ncbi:MAG: lipoprotein [Rhizobacter sp.]|nr:lipoprotein [Rhizobacter sp.]
MARHSAGSMTRRTACRAVTWLVSALCLAGATHVAHAADAYPTKPIRMVIAFPPGGPTDVNARLFAQAMGEQLGQVIIVDNRAGAGGNIASGIVAGAPADGYTILYNTSSLLLGAMLYKSAKVDPIKDLAPVVRTVGVPLVVAVSPTMQVKTMAEFVDKVKQQPGKLNYASSGVGTIDHLAAALLSTELGLDMVHVPYKGTAPALTELIGGGTQMFVTTLNTLLPFITSGKLQALAIASLQRSSLLPDVPTVSEAAGLKGFEITAWNGIVVPAATPPSVVMRLNAAANTALHDKEFLEKLRVNGAEPYGGTPQEYGAYLKSEQARWKTVTKRAGVEPE